MVLELLRNLYQRIANTAHARCYRKQLLADKVSFIRVLLCGGTYAEYTTLQQLYADIDGCNTASSAVVNVWNRPQRAVFWEKYWMVNRRYQPWLVAYLHRVSGLQDEDPFCKNPNNDRMWLYSDILDFDIPCRTIWDWLEAATSHQPEYACLLSGFPHQILVEELLRRVSQVKNADTGYVFVAMSLAMLFRMTLTGLAHTFSSEADAWKTMYAAWDIESRLLVLGLLASLDRIETRRYAYAWGPDLFPQACGMLDVACAIDAHPARLMKQWYEQRGAPVHDMLPIEGLI